MHYVHSNINCHQSACHEHPPEKDAPVFSKIRIYLWKHHSCSPEDPAAIKVHANDAVVIAAHGMDVIHTTPEICVYTQLQKQKRSLYYLGNKYKNKAKRIGANPVFDVTDPLIL